MACSRTYAGRGVRMAFCLIGNGGRIPPGGKGKESRPRQRRSRIFRERGGKRKTTGHLAGGGRGFQKEGRNTDSDEPISIVMRISKGFRYALRRRGLRKAISFSRGGVPEIICRKKRNKGKDLGKKEGAIGKKEERAAYY